MGKLAAWGALAGLGKGMIANAEYQRKVDFAALEEAREMRLREYEQGELDRRETRRETFETGRDTIRSKHDVLMEATRRANNRADERMRQRYESASRDDTQAFTAAENKKKRESDEAQTRMQVDAKKKTGDAGPHGPKFEKADFTVKTFDKSGIPKLESIRPGVFDKNSGARYAQDGDKLFLVDKDSALVTTLYDQRKEAEAQGKTIMVSQGPRQPRKEVPIRAEAGPRSIQNLIKHPEDAPAFLNTWGYLPVGWYRAAIAARNED